jgi:hypothetical protein
LLLLLFLIVVPLAKRHVVQCFVVDVAKFYTVEDGDEDNYRCSVKMDGQNAVPLLSTLVPLPVLLKRSRSVDVECSITRRRVSRLASVKVVICKKEEQRLAITSCTVVTLGDVVVSILVEGVVAVSKVLVVVAAAPSMCLILVSYFNRS